MGRPKGSTNKPKAVSPTVNTPLGKKTVAEVKKNIQVFDERLEAKFARTKKALQLVDLSKTETRTYTAYNKDTLRTYLRDPKRYEENIRNVSRYLYRISYDYRRIVLFYAGMIMGDAFSITPNYDLSADISDEDVLQNFYETTEYWQKMDFASELLKCLIVAWREDTVYGYIYDDSDQEGGTFYIHILDGDYCRISSVENGIAKFAFDFSYFRKYQTVLDYWDREFTTKYDKYVADTSLKWQEIDSSRIVCFKVNIDDPTMDYCPLAPTFEHLINLSDLQNIQHVKDSLSIYKLLVARLKPLSGTDEPDDFEVDVETALEYYRKLEANLPDEVAACISPIPIEPIEFDSNNSTKDSDMIANSSKNLFNSIGGVILNTEKTGTTIYEAQILSDMRYAQSTLLPQINRWINFYLDTVIGTHHAYVKYIEGVSPYTRKAKRKELLESAQNGFATVLEIGVLDGNTPKETIAKLRLQNALGLQNLMIPLSTSYTKSNSDTDAINGGRPTSDTDELSDEGARTREK